MNTLLLGPFTETDRTKFINEFCLEYMMKHRDVPFSYARKQARGRWRKHVYYTLSKNSNCTPSETAVLLTS